MVGIPTIHSQADPKITNSQDGITGRKIMG